MKCIMYDANDWSVCNSAVLTEHWHAKSLFCWSELLVQFRRQSRKEASMNYLTEVDIRVLDTSKPIRREAFVFCVGFRQNSALSQQWRRFQVCRFGAAETVTCVCTKGVSERVRVRKSIRGEREGWEMANAKSRQIFQAHSYLNERLNGNYM